MLEMDDLLERSSGLSALSIDLSLVNEDATIGEYNKLIWLCGHNVCVLLSKVEADNLIHSQRSRVQFLRD
jgi:hypothetical protein